MFAVALGAVALRGEDTRNIIEHSACTQVSLPGGTDADRKECDRIGRVAAQEKPLRDTCIPFVRAMTPEAFERDTRCPQKNDREGVVPHSSPTASQQPGPSGGSQDTPDSPSRPSGPGNPSGPSTPSTPTEPSTPSTPEEPSEPTPEPPAPVSTKPLIDLGPVTAPVCSVTRPLINAC